MIRCRRFSLVCLVASGLIGVWGCGSAEPEIELAKVTGTVTLDGQTLDAGRVIFFNTSGYSATAEITTEGTYEVETALGETAVFIDHREPDITPPDGREGMPMPGKSLVPDKYAGSSTSRLKLDVAKGDNQFDIEMVN